MNGAFCEISGPESKSYYVVFKDNKTGKYLGVICISSDFLDLTPRDNAILTSSFN